MNAMRHWVMGAGLFLLLGAFVNETAAQDRLPIIDMHQHTIYSTDRNVQSMVAVMDEFHIVKAFLSGSLEDVYNWAAVAPGRFIPSPMFPWYGTNGFPDIDNLRAEYLAGRLYGMGEIRSQYLGIPPRYSAQRA